MAANDLTTVARFCEAFAEELRTLAKGQGNYGSMMSTAMQAALDTALQAIADRTPVNAGLMRGSLATDIHGTPPTLHGAVGSPLHYGYFVEYGRKPGKMPPVDAIEYWVIRKGLASAEDAPSVAFAIARAIGRNGTQGAHMVRDGMAAAQPSIEKIFSALTRDIFQHAAQQATSQANAQGGIA